MVNSLPHSCLAALDDITSGSASYSDTFVKIFISNEDDNVFDDDILYFVNDDPEHLKLEIRRLSSDGILPDIPFKTDWEGTLYLNIFCHLKCECHVEILSPEGTVMMGQKVNVFASPIELVEEGDVDKQSECALNLMFPLLVFPVKEQETVKRMPVQKNGALRLRIMTEESKVMFEETVSFGKIASEYHKRMKRKDITSPGLIHENSISIKLACGGSIQMSVAPFFLEEFRVGVRSAIYSLLLKRLPVAPDRYICRPCKMYVHWKSLLEMLRRNI